jgi:integrase
MRGCLIKTKVKRGLKKGESSWRIVLSLGKGPDGKYRQKWITFHGTRRQADAKLRELTGEVDRGEFVEPSKLTLGEYLDEWLDKAIKPPRRAQSTYTSYESIIRLHVKPALGHLPLQAVTPLHIERYYADLTTSPGTKCIHHAVLSHAFKSAVHAGYVRTNVASRTTNKPRLQHGEDVLHNVWNAEEAKQFLLYVQQHCSTQDAAFYALALDSGCRKCELLGLQWKDLDAGSLRVERQLVRIGGAEPEYSLPKSRRGRTLDISEETQKLLATHKREQAELKMKNRQHYRDHNLIFARDWEHQNAAHPLGSPLGVMRVNERLTRLCDSAKVKRITAHGLRHTSATLLLAAGVQAHVVQRRLGHKNITITLDIYGHVLPSMQQDAASKLAKLLHG